MQEMLTDAHCKITSILAFHLEYGNWYTNLIKFQVFLLCASDLRRKRGGSGILQGNGWVSTAGNRGRKKRNKDWIGAVMCKCTEKHES